MPEINEADVSDKPAWVRDLPLRGERWLERPDRGRRRSFETLASVDEAVESILTALEETGRLDNTVVMFLSDNGFAFAEHRWRYKLCAYAACTRTPLVVHVPGAEQRVDGRLVSHADIAPTIARLAGTDPATRVDGRSLAPVLAAGGAPWRGAVLLRWRGNRSSEVPGYWAVRTRFHLYVELVTGERELYDLGGTPGPADPFELENRAEDPAYASLRRELARRLEALRTARPHPLR
jgi:N-acetylglucosamine-6-sulfatase